MTREHVELDEAARVQQQFDAFTRGELAPLMLRLDPIGAAAETNLVAHPLESLGLGFLGHQTSSLSSISTPPVLFG